MSSYYGLSPRLGILVMIFRDMGYELHPSHLQMPSESSSVVCNATNGVEPPRDYLSIKKSKKGTLKQIVPSYSSLKNNYTLLWDMKNMDGYLNIMALIQKFMDQAISYKHILQPKEL